MLFNELFENKKVAEGFADEFAAFAKERGGVLRHGPQARKPETAPAAPAAPAAVDRSALAAELKQLQAAFDPQYQYSDDHSFWSKQHDIAQRIAYIKKQLSTTEQGVAEGADNLNYIGNCTDDDVIEHIFGDATGFAQAVEEYGDEFTLDDLVVKYDPETDVHSFYYKKPGVAEAAQGVLHRVRYSYDDPSGNGTASGHITLHAPDKASAARYATSDLTKRGKKNVRVHAVTPQKVAETALQGK